RKARSCVTVSTRVLYQTPPVKRGSRADRGYTARALFRVLACVLLAVLVLLAAACGGSDSKSGSKAVPADAAAEVGDLTIPKSRVVRQILVQSKPLANRLKNLARTGSDFATLARQYSTDKPTASVGGKVAIRKGQTSPAFDKVAFSIPTGKISEPIVTQYGWQILQAITPVRLAIVTPLSEVSSDIRRELLQQ